MNTPSPSRSLLLILLLCAGNAIASKEEGEAICKSFGGLKRVVSTSDETTPLFGRSLRISVYCKDGSFISRTRDVK